MENCIQHHHWSLWVSCHTIPFNQYPSWFSDTGQQRDMLIISVFVYLDALLFFFPSPCIMSGLSCNDFQKTRFLSNQSKFHASSVSFLGYIVAEGCLQMGPAKVLDVSACLFLKPENEFNSSSNLQTSTDASFEVSAPSRPP